MANSGTTRRWFVRAAQGVAALVLAGGSAVAAPAAANATPATAAGSGAVTAQLAPAITWANRHSYTVYDRCGGMSGWVQWTGSQIQTYGEVWTLAQSCGGPGYHYVKLVFDAGFPTSGQFKWLSETDGEVAFPGVTIGYNSGVLTTDPFNVSDVTVYLCSTEGTGNCNAFVSY